MKRTIRAFVWIGPVGILCCSLITSCFGEEQYFFGECSEDADLRTQINYHEGAICVDGHAQCPDGRAFCQRIAAFESQNEIILTCTGPCIECPNHGGACAFFDNETHEISYICVNSVLDCWSNHDYLPLKSVKEGCPLQTPDCR